jgi:hypothetical protein
MPPEGNPPAPGRSLPSEYVTDEAYLLDQNLQLLARILEVCREIRVILQGMADRNA